MPVIKLTVPQDITSDLCDEVESEIIGALRLKGVQGGITIWQTLLAKVPYRLLLEYDSRQDPPAPSSPNDLAEVAAKAVDRILGYQVEAMVIKLDPVTTGFFITRKE